MIRSKGFLIGEPRAVPCPNPRCQHVHRITVGNGFAIFPCEEKLKGGQPGERCNTHIFALRFQADDGAMILSIALDSNIEMRSLLRRLEPETEG